LLENKEGSSNNDIDFHYHLMEGTMVNSLGHYTVLAESQDKIIVSLMGYKLRLSTHKARMLGLALLKAAAYSEQASMKNSTVRLALPNRGSVGVVETLDSVVT